MPSKNSFLALFVRIHAVLCTLFIAILLVGCTYIIYQVAAGFTGDDGAIIFASIIVYAIAIVVSFAINKWCKVTNSVIQYAAYMWPACPRFDLLIKGAKSGNIENCQFFTTFFSFKHSRIALSIIVAIVTGMILLEKSQLINLITYAFLGFEALVFASMIIVGFLCANWSEA